MRILLCGANGFVGRHLETVLTQTGHEVWRGVRRPVAARDIALDYTRDLLPAHWIERLDGIDVLINAVGVLRDTPATPMAAIHDAAPRALFAACKDAGVGRVVQLGALGVGGPVTTTYFTSREAAIAALQHPENPFRHLLLRPSLLYGADGASTRLFLALARLPLLALPALPGSRLQPAHVDDLCDAVARWLDDPSATSQDIAVVGSTSTDLRGLIASYRAQLGHRPARVLSLPEALTTLAARLGDAIPASLLCTDTLRMLKAGSTADPAAFAALLGRTPCAFDTFLHDRE
ncbi:MAG: NAD-dependent epimerase/dehydratase family protein [Pseudomonadota bacterium]